MPCVTPDGDDSPKWVATLAARKEGAAPMARQENSCNHRTHLRMLGGPDFNTQPGVKGWRESSPIKLYPPTSELE